MVIKIRANEKYLDVCVEDGNAKIDIGLLDRREQWDLYNTLVSAANEISDHLEATDAR